MSTVNQHHYYATTALNWGVAATREESIARVARDAGASIIARQLKSQGGLYVCTYRVELPESAHYDIEGYMPRGVPLSERTEARIINIKGKTIALEEVA
jgi:hypothetical protein